MSPGPETQTDAGDKGDGETDVDRQPETGGPTETEEGKTRDTCGDKRLAEDRGSNKGEDGDKGVGQQDKDGRMERRPASSSSLAPSHRDTEDCLRPPLRIPSLIVLVPAPGASEPPLKSPTSLSSARRPRDNC